MSMNPASTLRSAALVVSYRLRTLSMMIADPTPKRRREARRMVVEKCAAVLEGALRMQREALRQARALWIEALPGGRRMARAGKRILAAGSAPAYRRLRANDRRLRRRKTI
jgi:hypothetical protein